MPWREWLRVARPTRAIASLLCLMSVAVLEWLALFGKARAATAQATTAEISATIMAPVPVVSVIEVLPPVISPSGAVLIRVDAKDWVSLPMETKPAGTGDLMSASVSNRVSAQQGSPGTLSSGMAVNVTMTPMAKPPRAGAVTGDGSDTVRVLVEFN
jgi:hypothetical protein